MRFLLVGPDQEENLSIRYLTSALRNAGHVAELARFNDARDADAVLNAARGYDWVGLSLCFQSRAMEFLDLAASIAGLGGPRVLMGGHFATCAPLELMTNNPAIAAIVLHEGEDAIVDIAAGRPLSEVPGMWFRAENGELRETVKRRSREDLESLPFPDRRGPVHMYAGVPTSYMMGSRGCVATCDYCCIVTLHRQVPGKKYRIRDPENIADEMAEQYHERGIRQFIFHDDNFLVPHVTKNMERIEAFASAWEKRGIKDIGFTIKCRPPDANQGVFTRLKELGLLRVFFGIESSSELGLKSIGRRQTIEQSEKALDVTRELGISAQYTMMMFHPDATPGTVRSDISFMQRHIDHALNFCRTEIYAGTPLLFRMQQEGRARGDYLAYTYRIADPQVEMASTFALRIFKDRCWKTGGLMERVIGLDHLSAVAGRFYDESLVKGIRRDIRAWRLECNQELAELLTDCVEACFAAPNPDDKTLQRRLRDVVERERASRPRLSARHQALHAALDAVVLPGAGLMRSGNGIALQPSRRQRMAHHASAVLIAMSAALATNCIGACEFAAPPLADSDGDGLPDQCERSVFGTDPDKPDSDGDGVPDGKEDSDGDGATNQHEQNTAFEWDCPFPAENDSDGDGLRDECETTAFGTDPNKVDSDGDSAPDGAEDSDGDGITNRDEQNAAPEGTCVPLLADSDGDGLPDKCETSVFGTNPNKVDSDGDSAPDGTEDSDGDGISNRDEQDATPIGACPSN